MIQVLHIKTDDSRELYRDITCALSVCRNEKEIVDVMKKVKLSDLELVAEVKAGYLEKAFELTNNIDTEWFENEKVKYVKKTRSTSIGDVMIKDGKIYVVASLGFIRLTERTDLI